MTEVLQQIVNWLTTGGIYALFALGMAIVSSVLRLTNFAYGELITISGYAMVGALALGAPWALVVPIALAAPMFAAIGMERAVFRPLRGAPLTTLLVASLALSLVLQNLFTLTISARPKVIEFPSWTDTTVDVGGVVISVLDIATVGVTAAVLAAMVLFLRHSVLGLALRAAAEDFSVTRVMGMKANTVITGAFAISGLLAGIGGLFFLATASVVTPTTGFQPLLKGFIAMVIGGIGSLSGAVAGAFLLAALEVTFIATLPDGVSPYLDAIVFVLLIAVLLFRPQGLFAARSLGAERV